MRVQSIRSLPLDEVAPPAITPRHIDCYDTGPDFPVGPRQIPHFGIVYIHSGKGWVQQTGPRQPLAMGSAFMVFPNVRYSFWVSYARAYSVLFDCDGLMPLLNRIGLNANSYLCQTCDPRTLEQAFERGLSAAAKRGIGAPVQMAAAIWTIVCELAEASERRGERKPSGLRTARRYLEEHAFETLSVEQLANKAALSRFHFMRAFKRQYGQSPVQYQIGWRMVAARKALTEGLSVKEAAFRAGYSDLCYFTRLFKQKTGMLPSEYGAQTLIVPTRAVK